MTHVRAHPKQQKQGLPLRAGSHREPAEAVFDDEAVKRLRLEGAQVYTMPDGKRVVALPEQVEE